MKYILFIFLIFSLFFACKRNNNEISKEYFDSGNLKYIEFFDQDSTRVISRYYDSKNQKIISNTYVKNDYDSIIYYYDNGEIFKEGKQNKLGLKFGNWNRYNKSGLLSDIREYFILKGKSILNRKFFLNKEGDTTWYGREFNRYDQDEFRADTMTSRNSTMNLFDFYHSNKDTIIIGEPFAASVRYNSPLARNYNSEIMMLLAKEKSNFNQDFSNEKNVVLDTFPNLKYDKVNQNNFQKGTSLEYVAVFGRWFDTPGKKILRGYVREYFEREPTKEDSIIKGETRVYFEKEIYVKDTIK